MSVRPRLIMETYTKEFRIALKVLAAEQEVSQRDLILMALGEMWTEMRPSVELELKEGGHGTYKLRLDKPARELEAVGTYDDSEG